MVEVQAVQEGPKPKSFVGSVISGITGFVKGGFSGGIIGAIAGAALLTTAVAVAYATGGFGSSELLGKVAEFIGAKGIGTTTSQLVEIAGKGAEIVTNTTFAAPTLGAFLGAAATLGSGIGAATLGLIGAAAGTITGVVKSREVPQPGMENVANIAKVSFAQGVAVGHSIEQAAHQGTTKHQDKITTERAAMAMAERQVIQ